MSAFQSAQIEPLLKKPNMDESESTAINRVQSQHDR